MRAFLKTMSVLPLAVAFVLVYTLRIYPLCSALVLLAWFWFLIAGAYLRSRVMALISSACWLLILIGFAFSLAIPIANPNLPPVISELHDFYYVIFLLPLSGLPRLHTVCIPISIFMLGLSLLIYWFLYRSTTDNKEDPYYKV